MGVFSVPYTDIKRVQTTDVIGKYLLT